MVKPVSHKGALKEPRDPLKEDLRNFLYVVWKHLNLPDPTPVQYDIAHYLQHGEKRMVVEAFRGVGKSWVTSAFVAWLLYRDPQLNILVVSATKERSDQFSTFVQLLIMQMDILAHLRPRSDQRFSKVAFDVGPAEPDHAPSVKSAAIFGQMAGSRADVIIADDIEIPTNSDTDTKREKLLEAVKEFDAILKPLPTSRIVYLGTPQSEQSIYNTLPDRGYQVRIWPALVPSEAEAIRYSGKLAPVIEKLREDPSVGPGSPTDPKRFSEHDLLERKLSYGRAGFSLQFMLDTTMSDAERHPLKLSDLIVMDLHPDKGPVDLAYGSSPELAVADVPNVGLPGDRFYRPLMVSKEDWVEYHTKILFVDPSGRGGDETAYCVLGNLHGRLYLLEAGAVAGGYDPATLRSLAEIAKLFKCHRIIVEPNFGDGMFNRLLEPIVQQVYPVAIEDAARSVNQKERRICDTLEPVMSQHRLVVDKGLIEKDYKSTEKYPPEAQNRYRLFYQLTRITRDRGALAKDDRIDVLAIGVHWFTDRMRVDTERAAQAERTKRLDAELRVFHESVLGYSKGAHVNSFGSLKGGL